MAESIEMQKSEAQGSDTGTSSRGHRSRRRANPELTRKYLTLKKKHREPLLIFYLNHLARETTKLEDVFTPAGAK